MMRVIITRSNEDGSYDEVGMWNRWLFRAASKRRIKMTVRPLLRVNPGRTFRAEIYADGNIYKDKPSEVIYFKRNESTKSSAT